MQTQQDQQEQPIEVQPIDPVKKVGELVLQLEAVSNELVRMNKANKELRSQLAQLPETEK